MLLKKRNHKKKIENYYINMYYKNNGINTRIFRFFLSRFFTFLATLFLFIFFTEGKYLFSSFWAAISVLLIFHYISRLYEKNKFLNFIKQVNEKIALEDFNNSLKSLDYESFILFIKEILERQPSFSNIEITDYLESEGIDILCKYKGVLTAVQCHLLDEPNTVEAKNIRELSRAMSRRRYEKGIIISNTDFREDTKWFCDLIKEKRKILLLNSNDLIKLAKKADKFPDAEAIRQRILKNIEQSERVFKNKRKNIFLPHQILSFFIYGTFLLLLSNIVSIKIRFVYIFCFVILLLLGAGGLVYQYFQKNTSEEKNWQDILDN